jgi:hypothetical protein
VNQFTPEGRRVGYRIDAFAFQDASMPPLFDQIKQWILGINWLAITRILVVQLIVLFAVGLAAARYVAWTSDVAQEEFARELGPTALGALSLPRKPSERRCDRRDGP